MKATIAVSGAWAELFGVGLDALEQTLTFDDPARDRSRAFRDGRWDGKVRLFSGRTFPAGHVPAVAAALRADGHAVAVTGVRPVEVPIARFGRDYLPGVTLRPQQYDACLAMLTNPRMCLRIPTRGGKTEAAIAVARYLWEEGRMRTLYVVPRKGLLHQTVRRFERYYGGDVPVGMFGDGVRRRGVVTVATAQTLAGGLSRKQGLAIAPADPDVVDLIEGADVLFLDETHHASAETWYEIAMRCGARRRYGMSGTPLTGTELKDARVIAATGPVLFETEATDLIDAGLANRPKIAMVMSPNASGPPLPGVWKFRRDPATGDVRRMLFPLPYPEGYDRAVVDNPHHNRTVLRCARWMADHGRGCLVLCQRKPHFHRLADMLRAAGLPFAAVYGKHSVRARDAAKAALTRGEVKVLLASEILGEGEDMPGLGAIVLAEGVKSLVRAVQRVGRGMERTAAGDVWVVDVVPTSYTTCANHALQRCVSYEAQGYETRLVEAWPADGDWPLSRAAYDALLPFPTWDRDAASTGGSAPLDAAAGRAG